MIITEIPLKKLHTLTTSAVVQELTKPLRKIGINYFTQFRIYDDGRMVRLANYNSWTEHFHKTNIYEIPHDLYSFYQTEIIPLSVIMPNNDETEILAREHGFCESIMMNYRNKGSIDRFYFGFEVGKEHMRGLVYERPSILHNFIAYFKEHAKTLLEDVQKKQFVYIKNDRLPKHVTDNGVASALDDCKIDKLTLTYNDIDVTLSYRQLQLLQLMKLGKTAKEIARELDLSFRTVQYYQQELKNKLNTHKIDFNILPALLDKITLI